MDGQSYNIFRISHDNIYTSQGQNWRQEKQRSTLAIASLAKVGDEEELEDKQKKKQSCNDIAAAAAAAAQLNIEKEEEGRKRKK